MDGQKPTQTKMFAENHINNSGGHITIQNAGMAATARKRQVSATSKIDEDNNKWANDIADAVCARLAAEQCLNWSGCDSNSPAYRYVKTIAENTKRKQIK